jgi:hypothetical protein
MNLSKLGILYVSLGAIVAAVACSGEEANDARSTTSSETRPSSSGVVVEKAIDGGASTSDAAP